MEFSISPRTLAEQMLMQPEQFLEALAELHGVIDNDQGYARQLPLHALGGCEHYEALPDMLRTFAEGIDQVFTQSRAEQALRRGCD